VEVHTVCEAVNLIKDGRLSSENWVKTCLDKIKQTDHQIGAWVHLDGEKALVQAKEMDEIRRRGKPVGLLHGVPVGIKDIVDTKDFLTEYGSKIHTGRQPHDNAFLINKLKEQGAIILGKTVSTEFAFMHPANTRNPYNLEFSPGGSSSGSAAAVAAGHVPLAIGSQTNGSTIRPASYCGIYGYKPTRGLISRTGVLQTSQTLDQMGLFSQHAEDIALLHDAVCGYDIRDPMSSLLPKPKALDGYNQDALIEPVFAWLELPYANQYQQSISQGSKEILAVLGKQIERIPAPQSFVGLIESHRRIYGYELYRNLEMQRQDHADELSDTIKHSLKKASRISDAEYADALEIRTVAQDWFERFFYDYDAILTPSALSEAPRFEDGTGDPICCTIWTLCGLPCISMPLLVGENQLPIGIQLVSGANEDQRMFRTLKWLLSRLNDE